MIINNNGNLSFKLIMTATHISETFCHYLVCQMSQMSNFVVHYHEILYVQCFQCLQKLSSSSSHVQSSLFTYHKSSDKPKWTHNLLSLMTFLNFLKLAGQLYKTRHGSGLPVHRGQTLLVHCLNKQPHGCRVKAEQWTHLTELQQKVSLEGY